MWRGCEGRRADLWDLGGREVAVVRDTEGQRDGQRGTRVRGARNSQRGVVENRSRAGAGLESGWNRAGVGLESGWSDAGAGGVGGVGLELSAPQEARGSSQRPVARSSPRKSRPGGRGQAVPRPAQPFACSLGGPGAEGGRGRPCERSAPQPWPEARKGREGHGEPAVATYRAS